MYFIAHFVDHGVYAIVPKTWILAIDDHWEKFVNNSLNRNQRFLCFYSDSQETKDGEGRPNIDYVPDFSLPADRDFPRKGCYTVKLVIYKESYDDALKAVKRRRPSIAPALYNDRRLNERPIPKVSQNQNATRSESEQSDDEQSDGEQSDGEQTDGEQTDGDKSDGERNDDSNQNENEQDGPAQNCDNGQQNNELAAENQPEIDQNAPQSSDFDNNSYDREQNTDIEDTEFTTASQELVDELVNNDFDDSTQNDEYVSDNQNNESAENQHEIDQNCTQFVDDVNNSYDNSLLDGESDASRLNHELNATNQSEIDSNQNAPSFEQILISVDVRGQCSNANDPPNDEQEINSPIDSVGTPVDPVKTEPLVIGPCSSNTGELENLLDDSEEIVMYDEDVIYTINKKVGFARPLPSNTDHLIKRENDLVSGNLAYNESKKGRIYMLGANKFEIPFKVIDTLKDWNTQPDKANEEYDQKVVSALLLMCCTSDDLANYRVNNDVKEFISNFLKIRVGENGARLKDLDKYIADFCQQKKSEADKQSM